MQHSKLACEKGCTICKRSRGWTSGEASLYKTLMSSPPLPPPPHWHLAFCVHKISFSSVPATKLLTQVASAEPGPQGHELLKTHDDTLSSAEAHNGYGEEKCDVMLPW